MFYKILFLLRIITVSSIFASYLTNPTLAGPTPVIAITQIAPHPSLDAIRQGILDELEANDRKVELIYENAQGNIALATQIAHKFVSLNPQAIVTISTPSAQAAYNVARKHNIPVVFAGVSDPAAAKLVDAKTGIGSGITGVSDFSPIEEQLRLIRAMQPDLKKLGILFNAAEANSMAIIAKLEKLAKNHGIELIQVTAGNTQEVATAVASLHGKIDALYIPNDNTIVSSLESAIRGIGHTVPIYAADPHSVERGCLVAAAFGQYEIGRQTGKILLKVLDGERPENIPVTTLTKVNITLNQQALNALRIKIPQNILEQNIKIVGNGA